MRLSWRRARAGVDESEIKSCASGCQTEQNKQWLSCRQRSNFSQTDTELDLVSSSKQQQQRQNTGCDCRSCLFCVSPSFSGPQLEKKQQLTSFFSSFLSSFLLPLCFPVLLLLLFLLLVFGSVFITLILSLRSLFNHLLCH